MSVERDPIDVRLVRTFDLLAAAQSVDNVIAALKRSARNTLGAGCIDASPSHSKSALFHGKSQDIPGNCPSAFDPLLPYLKRPVDEHGVRKRPTRYPS